MIQCGKCKYWHPESHPKEGYGECINSEAKDKAIHDMKVANRNERIQYEMEKLYNPYITDAWHRCMFGEVRDED